MSQAVRETILLDAPRERVWELIMDPTRLEDWVSAHASVKGAEPGPVGEGASFKQKLKLAGTPFKVEWTVVEADAPRLARWTGAGPAGSQATVVYRLEDEDGKTRFSYENEFSLPGGAVGKVAGGALAAAPGGREARRSLQKLKKLLESG